ncbi:hypothetical protein [Mucilaginibacter paludis]|uniref:Uncharacterized protein n=1 Tax=Mucilaginibacter paludis DSM 18603 TaxID=714943 RepID=H1YBM2_9SPHI|nr:hypothetical protein [Mucilaginibacter paludis]EHQ25093.1 hypothetical protein Mucpa_0913 [Mucilaginibacter paludis DSM 18603]
MNSKLFNPIKNKIAATIALLFFVVLGTGTMMAMKAPGEAKAIKKQDNTTWYYNGSSSSASAILTSSNWSTNTVPTDCQSGGNRPCSISVAASDQAELQTFLNGETKDDVMALAPQQRP